MLLSLVIRDCSQFIQHLSKFFFHIFIIFVGQALKLEEEDGRSSGSGSVIIVISVIRYGGGEQRWQMG